MIPVAELIIWVSVKVSVGLYSSQYAENNSQYAENNSQYAVSVCLWM